MLYSLLGETSNIIIMYGARRLSRLKILVYGGIFPFMSSDVVGDSPTSRSMVKEEQRISGMDRLRVMFSLNDYGAVRPELHSCMQGAFTGMFIGATYGGFIWSKRAFIEFMERNQATAFRSHNEAKKALQDHVTVNFAKGAFMWGWRLAMFTGSFMLVSTTVSVYRGKQGIIEYVLGGAVSGSLFRTHLGLRGMLVGGLMGVVLGTCGGCVIYSLLKITGVDMDEIRALQYKWKQSRIDNRIRARSALQDEDDPIFLKDRDKLKDTISSLDLPDPPTEK